MYLISFPLRKADNIFVGRMPWIKNRIQI